MSSRFIIIPDTNVMRPNDRPEMMVANGFTQMLNQIRKRGKVELFVPSIVRDELIAQKMRLARRALEQVRNKVQTLVAVSGIKCDLAILPDELAIRDALELKFNDWATEFDAQIIDAPTNSIDWKRFICDAVHRAPPFEPASDDSKIENGEKGFKDALVLESASYVEAKHSEASIVLITKDALLKQAALKRLNSHLVFESLSSFESHLAQLHDQASESFALQLAEAAKQAWDTSKDGNLFDTFQIKERFQKDFAANLANPPRRDSKWRLDFSSRSHQGNVRIPLGEEAVIVSAPEYMPGNADHWCWKTEVEMSQLFQRRVFHPESGLSPYVVGEDVRISRFIVFWNSAKNFSPVIIAPEFDHLLIKGIWIEAASNEQVMGAL